MKRLQLESTFVRFDADYLVYLCDFLYEIFFYLFSCVCEFIYWVLLLKVVTKLEKTLYLSTARMLTINIFILINSLFSKDLFISLKLLIFIKNDLSLHFFYLSINILPFKFINSLAIDMITSQSRIIFLSRA